MTSQIVSKLRYMARQYTSGSVARGGNPGKHYLDEAADRIEELEAAQPAVEPLTDEEIVQCAEASDIRTDLWRMGSGSLVYSDYCNGIPRADFTNFVRAIERAHGVTQGEQQ